MSDLPPPRPPRQPSLFEMWGRETVKDLTLVVASIPVLVCVVFIPVLATQGGDWLRLAGLFLLFVAVWLLLRRVLRRWVAKGADRGEPSPSPG